MIKALRYLGMVSDVIENPETLKNSRTEPRFFTRNRKMVFGMALRFMLDMLKTTLHIRLISFFKDSGRLPLSQQAFSKLRGHFTHYPFEKMVRETVAENYESSTPTWRGFHLLSIDGTHAQLPICKQIIEAFGVFGAENCPSAGISVLYDVLSGWIIDPIIGKSAMNERANAERHIGFLSEKLPHIAKVAILLMDRGYPSDALLKLMARAGILFVLRASTSFLAEVNAARMGDSVVVLKDGSRLRVFKFALTSGEIETLITNVFSLPSSDLSELYRMRWGVETAYFRLKRELGLEKFSGKTENSVLQDFWASVVIFNFVAVTQAEADAELAERQDGKCNKHVYRVRTSDLIILLRDQLIFTSFLPNQEAAAAEFHRLLVLAARSVSAIRPGRSFQRKFRHRNVNNNLKSAL